MPLFSPAQGPVRVRSDSDRLVFRDQDWFGRLFGVPFAVAGGAVTWLFFAKYLPMLVRLPYEQMGVKLLVGGIVLANTAFFLPAGLWMMFGLRSTEIDRKAGTVTQHWRLLAWSGRETWPIAGTERVEVERTGGSWRTGPRYGVFLVGTERRLLFTVGPGHPGALAAEIADFLGVAVG